jgi:hypothetical protein
MSAGSTASSARNAQRADGRDPAHRDQALEAARELGVRVHELERLLLQALQALREMLRCASMSHAMASVSSAQRPAAWRRLRSWSA